MPVYSIAAKKKAREAAALQKRKEELAQSGSDEEDEEFVRENEEDSDRSSVEEEEAAVAAPKQRGAKKAPAAAAAAPAAAKVEFSEPAQWVERMVLTSTRSLPADLKADDDPKREEAFIQQTMLSVVRGLALLDEAGVPWKRPSDYYAEMFKTDVHMGDVRQAMDASKARIEAQAHRRAMKDQKKYGKEVQAEVLRQRAKYKRDMQDRLSDWKKKRKGNGALRDFLNEDEDVGGDAKRSRREQTPRQRNLRPGGGGAKKRPGKNSRRRN